MEPLEVTKEAARIAKMAPSWLYRNWKRIPAARRAGRSLRWDVGELKEWMRRQAESQADRENSTK